MVVIPTRSDSPSFVETVSIGDTTYRLAFSWNEREGFWYMDISTDDDDPILLGLKLVANWELMRRFADERLPDGQILVLDQSGRDEDPGRNDLGDRVILVFATNDEIAALP